jgi:hypothetical protein
VCIYSRRESMDVIARFMAEHAGIGNAARRLRAGVHSGDPDGVDDARSVVLRLMWPQTADLAADLSEGMAVEDVCDSVGRPA